MVESVDIATTHMQSMLHNVNGYHGRGYDFIIEPEMREQVKVCMLPLACKANRKQTNATLEPEKRLMELRSEGRLARFDLGKVTQFYTFMALHEL